MEKEKWHKRNECKKAFNKRETRISKNERKRKQLERKKAIKYPEKISD